MVCFLQVLNLLIFKLTKRQYDEALLGFLFVDEHLVDIGDDLVDYEVQSLTHQLSDVWKYVNSNLQCLQDDVIANSFNIYRGDNKQL